MTNLEEAISMINDTGFMDTATAGMQVGNANDTGFMDTATAGMQMGNASVSTTAGNIGGQWTMFPATTVHTTWWPIYPQYQWWPIYWPYEDKTARAFRTVKVLMDKKLVKLETIEQFIELVDEIIKVV